MAETTVMRQVVMQPVVDPPEVPQQVVNPNIAKWAHLKNNQHCSFQKTLGATYLWKNAVGDLHRVDENGIQDGPAVIWEDGYQVWGIDGKAHRLDGPAVIHFDGDQCWWLDNKRMTQEEWAQDPRVIAHHSQTPEEAEEWLARL